MARRLKLAREWIVGRRIGGGGFGQVYEATGVDGETAAVKLVPKAPGANRELLFVELKGIRNVVPIIDSGETEENWALVMPRADRSLRQYLDEAGRLGVSEAVAILKDVATALADMAGKVVHRDLKPENVLLLNGLWCLSDFGISRYAEASTAPDTQKYALSAPYAAPERWRMERASSATDVYSFGVMGFELISGSPPFSGLDIHDFREQHLHHEPPPLSQAPAPLSALIKECLFKAPGARPNAGSVLSRLSGMRGASRAGGLAMLEQANLAEVEKRAESERIASAGRSAAERRSALFKDACASLRQIEEALFDGITAAASSAVSQRNRGGGRAVRLGEAQLELRPAEETPSSPWNWDSPAFEVIAHTQLILRIPTNYYGYDGRAHSLWFADVREAGHYQWFETAFMLMPLTNKRSRVNPFALDPGQESAKALWTGVAEFQLAWPIEPVNIGDLDEFIDRWATWFAEAAQGCLQQPSHMPERGTPRNWRQK